jgi:MoaA/NifB/PqqE/SkfB family radical SAM enzyme
MPATINTRELYRLPWSLPDNGISWLEPTAQCNLVCDGCYRRNRVEHKTWEQTLADLDVFDRTRKSDALSIAGGDPLLYPDILRTIAEAARRGYKPVVNTNGHALNRELLRDMKQAGLAGFTFHVDSKQGRPGKWKGKNELELCELRDELAEMAAEFKVGCSFNATTYPDTLQHVPALVHWAERRMDVVHLMVFILYRDMLANEFRYYAGDQEIDIYASVDRTKADDDKTVYNLDTERSYKRHLTAEAVVDEIRKEDPEFRPSAYLNGTQDPTTVKWLLAGRVGRPGKTLGYVGPKVQEIIQTTNHLFKGRYLAYTPVEQLASAKPMLLLAAVDDGMRNIARNALRDLVEAPIRAITEPLRFQSVLIIQPIDFLPDGRTNMCDGCPDMTVWNGELVWSCRMDEQERYGRNLHAVLRNKEDGNGGSPTGA